LRNGAIPWHERSTAGNSPLAAKATLR